MPEYLPVRLALLLLTPLLLAATVPMPTEPASAGPERAASDARAGVDRGELVPLEPLLADAERRHPGRVLEVELEGDEYEIEILQADGVVVELTYDAHDGRLLEIEFEDD